MGKIKIIETKDGSHSLYHEDLDETYHSGHGAYTESQFVFIDKGLNYLLERKQPSKLTILEIGFGTGLNAILTIVKAMELKQEITFISLEPFPLSDELIQSLNYKKFLPEKVHAHFDEIHLAPWEEEVQILPNFTLKKLKLGLENFTTSSAIDLVYFDAFAPSKQPEMWTVDYLKKTVDVMGENSLFVTYCAQGQFRRNLISLGLEAEKTPGPPGKREMVRAVKW
ncbi:tRNA (5-methylaminomethyl-2-thiouridine)(34)-methyltransferase MnmD [Flammeovirgaceae bacterium SG7u.111]|nr:tRNA (5-methylaminomethyl-2-thiouridine)(34)-methyltransferase MnmD [Flammeovirgaceae bacterium SG7u.132]WPO34826.1 tRNA (5-methylaminomethyl-2-thiouridine)(34)-methyltransferase MnmD [Flammeovirgaceae bacterium SG7u.111]